MKDKVNIKLIVPEINQTYNLLVPINKKIGTIAKLINEAINELSNGSFPITNCHLYNADTLQYYEENTLLYSTDIRNSTKILLLSKKI